MCAFVHVCLSAICERKRYLLAESIERSYAMIFIITIVIYHGGNFRENFKTHTHKPVCVFQLGVVTDTISAAIYQ